MNVRKLLYWALAIGACFAPSCGGDASFEEGAGGAGGDRSVSAAGGEAPTNCTVGEEGCTCAEGFCQEGLECSDGVCSACERGTLDCRCFNNGSCAEGYTCDAEAGVCDACLLGTEGCACQDGSCATGLACANDVCAEESCTPGTESCPCDEDDTCYSGLVCVGNGTCAACSNDVAGCPCEFGACDGGLICGDEGLCRDSLSCDEARVEGTCGDHQVCSEQFGVDAICEEGVCESGYIWGFGHEGELLGLGGAEGVEVGCFPSPACLNADCLDHQLCEIDETGTVGTCLQDCETGFQWDADTLSCTLSPCDPVVDNVALQACASEYRSCYINGEGSAVCGDCKDFASEDLDGVCLPEFICAPDTTDGICDNDEYCVTDDRNDDALGCQTHPCLTDGAPTPGEARGADAADSCSACQGNLNCSGDGFTGRVYAVKSETGDCVCETQEGYFIKPGESGSATPCDVDGDGWVNADSLDSNIVGDDAYWENNRCNLRYIDRFRLTNEYHQQLDVVSCEETQAASGNEFFVSTSVLGEVPSGCTPNPIALTEPEVLDRGDGNDFPSGSVGRDFDPAELNSLTKGCFKGGDFNFNDVDDIEETQKMPGSPPDLSLPVDGSSNAARLGAFAYWMEWHVGYLQEGGGASGYGAYVIAEKSRCDQSVLAPSASLPSSGSAPFDYDELESDGGYWRQCLRSRKSTYDSASLEPGNDFGAWTCSAADGGCAISDPPMQEGADTVIPALSSGQNGSVVSHGLCDLNSAPAGLPWLGMNHNSQFQCVVFKTTVEAEDPSYYRAVDPGSIEHSYADSFNTCEVTSGQDLPDEATDIGSLLPAFECESGFDAATPTADSVGWMAEVFVPYSTESDGSRKLDRGVNDYESGCVDEAAHWYALCTSNNDDHNNAVTYGDCRDGQNGCGTLSTPEVTDSGKLTCGCNGLVAEAACLKYWGDFTEGVDTALYEHEELRWGQGVWK